jgi:hypothetical protein
VSVLVDVIDECLATITRIPGGPVDCRCAFEFMNYYFSQEMGLEDVELEADEQI